MDELMLFHNNSNYEINDKDGIVQPTLLDIERIGYDVYQNYVSILISNIYDVADVLWFDLKIWYEDIGDEWQFFMQKHADSGSSVILRIDNKYAYGVRVAQDLTDALNFFFRQDCEYAFVIDNETSHVVLSAIEVAEEKLLDKLVNKITKRQVRTIYKTSGFYLDADSYKKLSEFIKTINWMKKDYMFLHGGTRRAKIYILQQINRERNKPISSSNITLTSIISSLIAKGLGYRDIWDMPIYMIYDQYYRHLKIDEWNNTMGALHSGCLDTKKHPIRWEKINWSSVIQK
jgi:hypothetical protein